MTMTVQRNVTISKNAMIAPGAVIAEDVSIGSGAILTDFVTVEEDVEIGSGVIFAGSGPARTFVRMGCRIAAGAVVGAAVELGRGCEIRPGSVVLASVPPNAIVQGNPAGIVGYTRGIAGVALPPDQLPDEIPRGRPSVPSILPLGIGKAALHRMRRVADLRGTLTVGEVEEDLPFAPRRYFIVFEVPSRELRGEHAHKVCEQFLICIRGSCRILLDDGRVRREVVLDRPDMGVYMPPMIWGTQYQYSREAALLVFASHSYDANDYIRTYNEFLAARSA